MFIFHFICFFLLNKLPWSKRQSGRKGERKQLEWGDSLRRGIHADETYLGRPCVHGAPKLPVLKHWLAVSCLFPRDSKRLLCLSFNISKGKKERGGEGKIVLLVFCWFVFLHVRWLTFTDQVLSVSQLQIGKTDTKTVDLNVLLIVNTNPCGLLHWF